MWKLPFNHVDPVVRSAGAALLCTLWTQHHSSRQSELGSEALCWSLLPVLFIAEKRFFSTSTAELPLFCKSSYLLPPSMSLWVVAMCIVFVSCYKAEIGMALGFPFLTPVILLAEGYTRFDAQSSRNLTQWFFLPLVNPGRYPCAVAVFTLLAVSNYDVWESFLSFPPFVALCIVYKALTVRKINNALFLPLIDLEYAVVSLSLRVVCCILFAIGVQSITFGLPNNIAMLTFVLGVTKAFSWFFIIRTTRYTSWCIGTTIATFSMVSDWDTVMEYSDIRALSRIVASFLALGQTIYLLPKQTTKNRSLLWGFLLVPISPYMANIYATIIAQSSIPSSFDNTQIHPVAALMDDGRDKFDRLLQNQSKSFPAACDEYRRRYNMEPPEGFEAWFSFAVANQSPIIDEFDYIVTAISPFWRLSGKEVGIIMNSVQNTPNIGLWLCIFSGENSATRCTHPDRTFDRHIGLLFNTLLGNISAVLPSVKFLVNHLDEPRVVALPKPAEENESCNKGQFRLTDMSRQPTWDAITRSCTTHHVSKIALATKTIEKFSLPFVSDRLSSMDLCQHPEYSVQHGLFISPTSFHLIEGLVPILTPGSPSTMSDILFPSPAYLESEFRYDAAHDPPWNSKANSLYWTGSTTGGFASTNSWRTYHRQRFVELAQNLGRRPYSYLREKNGVVVPTQSSFLNPRLYNVGFTRIFQCAPAHCRAQSFFFSKRSWEHKDAALRSRLVFDIDGNGISGRFYKLLASRSVPLKQTLLREWHDERLVPWVHYVPVSMGMEEMPELVRYLTGTETGRDRAREVAEQGRDWFGKAMRDVDMAVYMYRLLLELARLQDPEREVT